jgi:hypothetical protein
MTDSTGGCCGQEKVFVSRVILDKSSPELRPEPIRSSLATSQNIVDFKALSARNGTTRKLSESRRMVTDGIQVKASRLGSSLLSYAIPGDTDPFTSPVRSATYRTLTPGFGGGNRNLPSKPNRGYRCPEGYQYGGRFTDSRLSTCGAKLFDIPSPLGMAIAEIRKIARRVTFDPITGKPLKGGEYPGSIVDSRKPQIPKVGLANTSLNRSNVKQLMEQIAAHNEKVARMVRRDGFVLEPVVPPKVLRAIPDNRDMEGATYLMSAFGAPDIGNDELGMLSNTGITRLVYVTPSGSTISLEKRRPLTVGERRKLGKVVTIAMGTDNSKDPAARLKVISSELGDGIGYSEDFNISEPNKIVRGRAKWATEVFKRTGKPSRNLEVPKEARETVSTGAIGKKITSVDEAVKAIAEGENLARISPSIMSQVLAKSNVIKVNKINNEQSVISVGSLNYIEYTSPKEFQHLSERFASDVQEHLGLASPDIIFAEKPGDKRKYLMQDVADALPGATFNPNRKFSDLNPQDVARMMIADYLTDQRVRPLSSVYAMDSANGTVPMLARNTTSGLVDLSKIQISKRSKLTIADFYGEPDKIDYSAYYNSLREEQKVIYKKFIDSLLRRAKSFKMRDLKSRLDVDGLSDGEKIHLNIMEKIYETRLNMLLASRVALSAALRGRKK